MTQKDKELLLKDLCGRLPYNPLVHIGDINVCDYDNFLCEDYLAKFRINFITLKPYLRPLSSITEDEEKEFNKIFELELKALEDTTVGHSIELAASSTFMIDFYNKHHFDYRGLIEKGLAIAVTEENNPYKE